MRSVLALMALAYALVLVEPARGCVQDSEIVRCEREFKSSYLEGAPLVPTSPLEEGWMLPLASVVLGSMLLLGACVLSQKRTTR